MSADAPLPRWNPLREPRGHGATLAGLFAAAREQRLPHALLFCGPEGIGKFPAALHFAAGLLCERGPAAPCGDCPSCKRVAAGSSAEMFVLDVVSEGAERLRIHRLVERSPQDIPKEDRDKQPVDHFLSLRSATGSKRVVCVRAFERAVQEAQNAILKLLEEPAEDVFWVLETSRPGDLLPTIRSRSVAVPFAALADEDVDAVLAAVELGVGAPERAAAVRWARGSVGIALGGLRRRVPAMRALVWEVLCGASPLAAAREIAALEGKFDGATPRVVARDRARTALDVSLQVAGDVIRADAGRDRALLAHGDLDPNALPGSPAARRVLASDVLEALGGARADVDLNLAPEACIERGMLALARFSSAGRRLAGPLDPAAARPYAGPQ